MHSKNRALIALATILAVAAALTFGQIQPSRADKDINWKTDFNAAVKEAAKSKKPLMVDFYADWCGWCKKLDKDVYTNSKVIEASDRFVAVKLNAESNGQILKKYGVRGLPTVVFLKPNSKEISRIVGYRSADDFVKEMNKAYDAVK